ncbi:MAG: hypothetical protein CMM07_04685 [Rhodopirellula sp.]|nr:hypothetical protein [Rhodopirellula sp.]
MNQKLIGAEPDEAGFSGRDEASFYMQLARVACQVYHSNSRNLTNCQSTLKIDSAKGYLQCWKLNQYQPN